MLYNDARASYWPVADSLLYIANNSELFCGPVWIMSNQFDFKARKYSVGPQPYTVFGLYVEGNTKINNRLFVLSNIKAGLTLNKPLHHQGIVNNVEACLGIAALCRKHFRILLYVAAGNNAVHMVVGGSVYRVTVAARCFVLWNRQRVGDKDVDGVLDHRLPLAYNQAFSAEIKVMNVKPWMTKAYYYFKRSPASGRSL